MRGSMAETLTQQRLITAEEFWQLCGGERRLELVDGKVVEMPPVGPSHGSADRRIVTPLGIYVDEHVLGDVYLNTGFILRRDPDLVRGPDQAFVSAERIRANPPPAEGFWPIAPDLAVEIVSPNDTAEELNDK